jgi:hypothetical protein
MLRSSRATIGTSTLRSLPPIQPPIGLVQVPPIPLQMLGALLLLLLLQMIGVHLATLLLPLQVIVANQRVVLAETENQKKRIIP